MPRYSERTGLLQTYQPGPYDAAHLYLQWGGSLPGGETWSNGIRFASTTGAVLSPNDQDAMIDGCVTALSTWHAESLAHSSVKLQYVKLNAISVDGKYSLPGTTTERAVANVAGTVANPLYPNQIALVVSTETGFGRGIAHSGRFYVPVPALQVGVDGRIFAADAAAVDTRAETLRTALNALNPGYKLAVFSRKLNAPAHRLITAMRVGRVLDTQRRRRRSLVEVYQ